MENREINGLRAKKREKIRIATIDQYNVSAGRTYLVGMKAGRWAV